MNERELIVWLRQRIKPSPAIALGPGDDAAVINIDPRSKIITTVDAFLEGTHFESNASASDIGQKAIGASVSDIAAMGCYPLATFVTLGIRRSTSSAYLMELGESMISACERFGAPLSGGDITSWDAPLSISVTVLGETRGLMPVLRSGARAGDRIFVTGTLGGSIHGKHLLVEPRIEQGIFLNNFGINAMMDMSDGLSTDLNHICRESNVGAVIREADIPASEAAKKSAEKDGRSAASHAINDGEDFELLFTVAAAKADALRKEWPFKLALTEIGEITPGGVFVETATGKQPLTYGGYEHRWS